MRHPLLFAAAALAAVSVLAQPAAAQKPGTAPHAPVKAAPPPAGKPQTAASPSGAPVLNADGLATAASLDAATKARVAPHVAAMNKEMAAMHGIMGKFSRTLPRATQDSMHAALKVHYDAFDKHWKEADATLPAAKQPAFDAAVRQQMNVRSTAAVGNPHQHLPATHPKVDRSGNPVKK